MVKRHSQIPDRFDMYQDILEKGNIPANGLFLPIFCGSTILFYLKCSYNPIPACFFVSVINCSQFEVLCNLIKIG